MLQPPLSIWSANGLPGHAGDVHAVLRGLLALLCLTSTVAYAQEPRLPKLAVLELSVEGNAIKLDDATGLTDVYRSQLAKSTADAVRFISKEKVFEILKSVEKVAATCTADCEIQTAREIGADYVATGSIALVGKKTVLVLEIKRSQDGAVMASENVTALPDELLDRVRPLADTLAKGFLGRLSQLAAQQPRPDQVRQGESAAWQAERDDTTLVAFTSEPPGASVEIDGRALCTTPCKKPVALGKHNVRMSKEHFAIRQDTVNVTMRAVVSWPLQSTLGTLLVDPGEPGLTIQIDGEMAGKTPLSAEVEAGRHSVELVSPCHAPASADVTVKAGERKTVSFKAQPLMGGLRVSVTDQNGDGVDGEVLLDGKPVGATHQALTVSTCGQLVVVRVDGVEIWRKNVQLRAKETVRLDAEVRIAVAEKSVARAPEVIPEREAVVRAPLRSENVEASPVFFRQLPPRTAAGWTLGLGIAATAAGLGTFIYGVVEASAYRTALNYDGSVVRGDLTFAEASARVNAIRSHQIIGGVIAGGGAIATAIGAVLFARGGDSVAISPSLNGIQLSGWF